MNRYRAPSAIALLFLALATLSACAKQPTAELVIAAVAPMTGQYGEMGKDLLNAVQMAVDDKNRSGGIRGRQVRLVTEDDKASPKDAVTVAQKIAANTSIIGIVGHMNSGTMLAASSVYSQSGVPVVMPVPTNPQITKQGFSNLFRVPITDDKQGPACASFIITKLNKNRIAIIHNKDAYGEGIATETDKYLKARDVTPVAFDTINPGDQDYRALLTRLKGSSPEVIFFGGGYAEAALLIKQAREVGLNSTFVMGDGCFDTQLMKIAGAAANGSYVSNIAPTTAPDSKAEEFYKRFQAAHGKIVAFAPLGYVSAGILLDAIEKAPTQTREGVLKVLSDPNYKFASILGDFSFEPNGDSKGQRVFMHTIDGSVFKTVAW